MIVAGSLELTHARVLARHGERLAAADWRRIEAIRDWAPALELARTTALRYCVSDRPPLEIDSARKPEKMAR